MVIVKRAMCQPVAITVSDFVQYRVLILNSKQMFAATRIIDIYVCVRVYVHAHMELRLEFVIIEASAS